MRRNRPAFTIIELLTVMAILSLLMAILLPTLSAARRAAKANACLSNLKGIGTSFVVYLNENEDFFPPAQLNYASPTDERIYVNGFGRGRPRWHWFLETDHGPVVDPGPFRWITAEPGGMFLDNTTPRGSSRTGPREIRVEVFVCPGLDDERYARDTRDGAYGYNYQYLGNARSDSMLGRWDNFAVGLHRIKNPAQTIVVADSRGAGPKHGKHSFTLDPPRMGTEVGAKRFGPVLFGTDPEPQEDYIESGANPEVYTYSPAEARHYNRANAVFVDGHAESRTLRDLGYQMNDARLFSDVPTETAIPIPHPDKGPYEADNRFFNGEGVDRIAAEHHVAPGGG